MLGHRAEWKNRRERRMHERNPLSKPYKAMSRHEAKRANENRTPRTSLIMTEWSEANRAKDVPRRVWYTGPLDASGLVRL